MDFLTILIVILVVFGIESFLLVSSALTSKNDKTEMDYVRLPKFYFYFGIGMSCFLMLPVSIAIVDNIFLEDPVYWLFSVCIFLSIAMALCQAKWRIYPRLNEFLYVGIMGIKKTYSYDDVKAIVKLKTGDNLIKMKGKLFPFVVDKYAIGWECFIKLYNKYKLLEQIKGK